MTPQQIAELREMLRAENTPVWGVTDGKTVTWTTTLDVSEKITLALRRWLPRLLGEREMLLKALKMAREFLRNDDPPWEQVLDAVNVALNKAEGK